MTTVRTTTLSAATLSVVLLSGGAAVAGSGGGGGAWPSAYPLPTQPGRVLTQTSSTAVVRSTDTVLVVKGKLDALYVTGLGCTRTVAVNKPRDYLCVNPSTGRTEEVFFTFAALDPRPGDASRSQTNAFHVRG